MTREKIFFIFVFITIAAFMASSTAFAAETFLSIATGGTSGTYYPIGNIGTAPAVSGL